jgi:hypothetical protein
MEYVPSSTTSRPVPRMRDSGTTPLTPSTAGAPRVNPYLESIWRSMEFRIGRLLSEYAALTTKSVLVSSKNDRLYDVRRRFRIGGVHLLKDRPSGGSYDVVLRPPAADVPATMRMRGKLVQQWRSERALGNESIQAVK